MKPPFALLLLILLLTGLVSGAVRAAPNPTTGLAQSSPEQLGVQGFLDQQSGPLKTYRDGDRSAATIIESNSLYYGLSPRLTLALLETSASLLSSASPPDAALRQPFGSAGPDGFAAQVEWANRELRAGLGPYDRPPTLRFTDGTSITLSLQQASEGVAVQRFLATNRTQAEWRTLVDRFGQVFQHYFNNELPELGGSVQPPAAQVQPSSFSLMQPWPPGARVVHLAYFDHVYPTVDSGRDSNNIVVTYTGQRNVQYNGHDGHDYYFPDQPIGSPILAAAAGTAYARTHRGNGVVIVHPDGYETVYWHLDGFSDIFRDKVDTSQGVRVEAGTFLGTSGKTGFTDGTPHLHFEVRRYGRQVDPYGWYGPGPDPCAAYAGCLASTWLWHPSLAGSYNFTPPDGSIVPAVTSPQREADTTPPVATLAVNPPAALRLLVPFENTPVQTVGGGFPVAGGSLQYEEGRYNQGLRITGGAELAFPLKENLELKSGTLSMWLKVPERYPSTGSGRLYLFAASASPENGEAGYPGTFALRREASGPDGQPRWNFWTVGGAGESERHDLHAPDTLAAGWHHVAISWDAVRGEKTLFFDGQEVARASGVILPSEAGALLHIGRFAPGGAALGATIDELAIHGRALTGDEVAALAQRTEAPSGSTTLLRSPELLLDTNAIDANGGIVAVQLGRDGMFTDPQPYYDAYRWALPLASGTYTVAVRYFDRASNATTVSQTVTLDLPPADAAVTSGRVYLPLVSKPQADPTDPTDQAEPNGDPLRGWRLAYELLGR